MIANKLDSNHHMIKRILIRNNIEINNNNRKRAPFTEEHKRNISIGAKGRETWSKGKKMSRDHIIKNMVAHIKYDVDFDFYNQYQDVEKLKVLNKSLTRDRVSKYFDTDKYQKFINKFYFDVQFNKVFELWVESGYNKWARPSLDHKTPISKGGDYDLNNLQFLTWFENRAKCDMTMDEWLKFKKDTQTASMYFV